MERFPLNWCCHHHLKNQIFSSLFFCACARSRPSHAQGISERAPGSWRPPSRWCLLALNARTARRWEAAPPATGQRACCSRRCPCRLPKPEVQRIEFGTGRSPLLTTTSTVACRSCVWGSNSTCVKWQQTKRRRWAPASWGAFRYALSVGGPTSSTCANKRETHKPHFWNDDGNIIGVVFIH